MSLVTRCLASGFILFVSQVVAKPTPMNDPAKVNEIVDTAEKIAEAYQQLGWFSGNLYIAKDGQAILSKSYGYQNIEKEQLNSVETKFNLGSIMKNFTKVLVLQQVEEGNLSLFDKLSKFNLGFPSSVSDKVTVEHLLNHTSGFADVFTAEYRENPLAFDTLAKKLTLLRDQPLLFAPGTEHAYSNYGYIVLGAVLEKVTKQPFEPLLNERIIKPVGMGDTSFKVNSNNPHQSERYTYLYDGRLKHVGITEHPGPDGGIESTVSDVQKFYRALFYSDKLLRRANEVNKKAFAMSGEHWGSYGGGLGVSAAVEVNLKHDFEVVVLANTDSLVAEQISTRIQDFINNGSFQPVKALETNYAYGFYKTHGKAKFFADFKSEYEGKGYKQFIGRTINELGMQLLKTREWQEAFDIFNYLASIFPNAPQVYDSLAYAFFTKGEPDKAHDVFKKALKLNKSFKSDYISNNFGHLSSP